MDGAILSFFSGHEAALPLYAALEEKLRETMGDWETRVQKTQISLYRKRLFACVSFLPVRRAKDRPGAYITLSIGLTDRIASDRIDQAVEVRPNRWTHHLLISGAEEIDGEVMQWIRAAAAFAER